MSPSHLPLRWESTGEQWWYASPIDCAAANGHYDLVVELLHLDSNLLIKLTSLRRIRRLETVWDDEEHFEDVAKCRSQVARNLMLECETGRGTNSLIRAGYGGWLLYTAASAGDADFVRELLGRNPALVFGEGEYGVTDIMYAAARSNNCEVFEVVLRSALSPAQMEEICQRDMMNRAVHAAARGGNWEMLKQLVGEGCGVPKSERVAKVQLEDGGEIGHDDHGLMGLSITLDQWLRLDSGIIEGDQNSEQTLKILQVHHSKITEVHDGGLKNAMDQVKTFGRKHGLLGNQLTVAFMVQLRNPLRNYEQVGAPMLVLTQVERVHMHVMQQDDRNFQDKKEKGMETLLNETSGEFLEDTNTENESPGFGFKIREIHLSGVLTKSGRRQHWGTATQQQSGIRWLLASGMTSTVKHSTSTSKAIVLSSPLFTKKLLNEDTLWSISCVNSIMGTNSKLLPVENVHIRNPDIIFPS